MHFIGFFPGSADTLRKESIIPAIFFKKASGAARDTPWEVPS